MTIMPRQQDLATGKHENKWLRALFALPLLGLVYVAHNTMAVTLDSIPSHSPSSPNLLFVDGEHTAPWCRVYTGWKPLDNFLALYAAVFTGGIGGYDPAGRMQMIAFLADLVPIQVIFFIEGNRRGNLYTVAHLL